MKKLSVMEWLSLDGVFDAELMGQWWNPYDSDERAAHIQEAIGSADAFVFGRRTYEMLAPYWSAMKNNEMGVADKLNRAPKYVVSSTLERGSWNNTTILKSGAAQELTRLKGQAEKNLLVMGSATLVHALMDQGVVDEYRFLVTPIVVGRGKRFFEGGTSAATLKLTSSRTLDRGVLALTYEPAPT